VVVLLLAGANLLAPASRAERPIDTDEKPPVPDSRFPARLPVRPFDIALFVPPDEVTSDLVHRCYQEQYQIDGGGW
jgi:hypothetical protein